MKKTHTHTSLNNKKTPCKFCVCCSSYCPVGVFHALRVASPVLWFPELLEDIAAIPDLRWWRSTEQVPSQFPKFPLITDTQKKVTSR